MNTVLRADCKNYLVMAVFKDTGEFTEDGLAEIQKEFQNFCIFIEDKLLYEFVNRITAKWLNLWKLTVVNKHNNYGVKFERVTT